MLTAEKPKRTDLDEVKITGKSMRIWQNHVPT